MSDAPTLSDFSLPAISHTGLFGVFLAVHAMEDALNVLHAGVGCKGKTQRQIVHHDRGRESHTRVGWTELAEEDLIRDAGRPFLRNVIELYRRRQPQLMLVTTSAAVDLTSPEMLGLLEKARSEVDCPLEWIPQVSHTADLYAGYGRVIDTLINLVPWDKGVAERPTLSVVGYFFHRHEMDQAANLNELRRLAEALGFHLGPTFLGGGSFRALLQAYKSNILIRLPYAGIDVGDLAGATGRLVLEAGLPMGQGATRAWIREIAASQALDLEFVEKFIRREEDRIAPRLELARRMLAGKRIAILADTPSAAGWVCLCQELGMVPRRIVLLDRSLGGAQALERLVAWSGTDMPAGAEILPCPDVQSLRRLEVGDLDVCVRPDLALGGTKWETISTVESGFPSVHRHCIFPSPELGYTGLVAQAQRLMDSVLDTH